MEGGGTITANLDLEHGRLTMGGGGAKSGGTYGLFMDRADESTEQLFGHDAIPLEPGDTATLVFGDWKQNGDSMPLVVTHNGAEETTLLTDEG